MAKAAAEAYDLDSEAICEAVMARERLMPTGIGNGLAVPHARLPDLKVPVVAVGLPAVGIDFDAPDDTAANIIFLILTPTVDNGAQLEILSDIATTFKSREVREKAGGVTGFTEFLALVRSSQGH